MNNNVELQIGDLVCPSNGGFIGIITRISTELDIEFNFWIRYTVLWCDGDVTDRESAEEIVLYTEETYKYGIESRCKETRESR